MKFHQSADKPMIYQHIAAIANLYRYTQISEKIMKRDNFGRFKNRQNTTKAVPLSRSYIGKGSLAYHTKHAQSSFGFCRPNCSVTNAKKTSFLHHCRVNSPLSLFRTVIGPP